MAPSVSAVVDCGILKDPDDGQVEFSNTTFESTANYTCDLGYSLNGNSTRTCEANGNWSGDPPLCECKWLKCLVNRSVYLYLSLQWLTVAALKILIMVKWNYLTPHLSQQPTTLAIWDTV